MEEEIKDTNDAESQFNLALNYGLGYECEANPEKSFYWFSRSAEQGFSKSQYFLAACYEIGFGCERNSSKALEWFEKAAEHGNEDAQKKLGTYKNENSVSEEENQTNNAEALFNQGACYELGENGVEKDLEKAFSYYKQSAELGYAEAQNSLGVYFDYGYGCEENPEQAFYWYKKSAEQDLAIAQYNLGYCYANGKGCENNPEQAFYWYKKAAEQGNAEAQNDLAVCYEFGDGCEKNLEQACYWYWKSAEQGYEDSINELKNNFAISLYVKYQDFMQKLCDDDLNIFFAYENKEKLWQAIQTFASEGTTDEEPILLYDDSALENCKNGFLITSQHLYAKNITSAKNICIDISEIKTVTADVNSSSLYFDDTKIETSEIPEDMLNDFSELINSIIEKIHSTERYDINLPDFEDIFNEDKGE